MADRISLLTQWFAVLAQILLNPSSHQAVPAARGQAQGHLPCPKIPAKSNPWLNTFGCHSMHGALLTCGGWKLGVPWNIPLRMLQPPMLGVLRLKSPGLEESSPFVRKSFFFPSIMKTVWEISFRSGPGHWKGWGRFALPSGLQALLVYIPGPESPSSPFPNSSCVKSFP